MLLKLQKHDVPIAAIPCLHQIIALNNQTESKKKKLETSDIHDGIIGHQTGKLDNQFGRHDNHHGNYDKKVHATLQTSSDEQSSDLGYHGNTDDDTVGNNNGPNVDGCHGNSHDNGDLSASTDGNHSQNDGGKVMPDSTSDGNLRSSDGNSDGTDGDLRNIDVTHSDSDGTCHGNVTNTDIEEDVSNMKAGNTALTNTSLDSTSDGRTDTESCDSTINTIHDKSDIATMNRTVSSIKALEKCDTDSGYRSAVEKPEMSQLQMCSVQDITKYLSKRWDFHDITKEQERKLLLTDTNNMPEDSSKEYKSTEILKTIPYLVQGTNPSKKERVVINPAGKSARSLLHEYCMKVMRVKPEYVTGESNVPKTPFLATVLVDNLKYGSGMAASKKHAKHVAAQKTLEILMPHGSFEKLMDVEQNLKVRILPPFAFIFGCVQCEEHYVITMLIFQTLFQIFDEILIEDPNVYELTSKLGLLSPSQVLSECIKR